MEKWQYVPQMNGYRGLLRKKRDSKENKRGIEEMPFLLQALKSKTKSFSRRRRLHRCKRGPF
jgi:hypothetical protein